MVEAVVFIDRHPVAASRAAGHLVVDALADLEQLGRPGDIDVLRSADGDRLQPLVAHDHADPARRAGVVVIDGGHKDPVFTGQTNGGHLDLLILQLFFEDVLGFRRAFAAEMRGVADFHGVVVDIQINQIRGLAADDDLVIAGMFQLGSEEASEQRMRHQVRLR